MSWWNSFFFLFKLIVYSQFLPLNILTLYNSRCYGFSLLKKIDENYSVRILKYRQNHKFVRWHLSRLWIRFTAFNCKEQIYRQLWTLYARHRWKLGLTTKHIYANLAGLVLADVKFSLFPNSTGYVIFEDAFGINNKMFSVRFYLFGFMSSFFFGLMKNSHW